MYHPAFDNDNIKTDITNTDLFKVGVEIINNWNEDNYVHSNSIDNINNINNNNYNNSSISNSLVMNIVKFDIKKLELIITPSSILI